jgi:hypothetical protein
MIAQTVREVVDNQVVLDIEGIDRLYLNIYQPRLQTGGGVAAFFKGHREAKVVSTTLMRPMSRDFVAAIDAFAERERIEFVHFARYQRKDQVTQEPLTDFEPSEGVLYIGVAQQKFSTFRVIQKISARTGKPYPWLTRSTDPFLGDNLLKFWEIPFSRAVTEGP